MDLFVPGRICLFGEHSDWAGGYRRQNSTIEKGHTIITGTNQGIRARVHLHPDQLVMSAVLPDGAKHERQSVPMEPERLLEEAQGGGFFSYAAGVAYQVLTHWQVGGIEVENYETDLPIRKGLSSSAAICVLVARAFNRLYDLHLTVRGEMDLAYRGEITTPSRCGRMDQGCAFGSRPVLMSFDQDLVEVDELRVGGAFHLLIVDLKGAKDTVKILADLNKSYPFASTERDEEVQNYLGPTNKRIVTAAVEALTAGDAKALGALMVEAQDLFDRQLAPSCPEELTAPRLHELLRFPALRSLVWGGKGVGSQGDGTAQLLCRGPDEQQKAAALVERELGMACLPLEITPTETVTRVIIPAAGFGSELFPAAKAVQKELFPVVDRDGVAKPVLLINVEEAVACELNEVVVLVSPHDHETVKRFFHDALSPEQVHRLPDNLRAYNEKIRQLGRCVKLVIQERPLGFGHAVHCARDAIADQTFALFLGDYLYRSNEERSCLKQLLDTYHTMQRSVVGVKIITEDQLGGYGVATGAWLENGRLLQITQIAEKPSVHYAREKLRVAGLKKGEYLGLFGIYVLGGEIFQHLENVIGQELHVAGQFQLTTALDQMQHHEECLAYVVNGASYDIGLPDSYIAALEAYRGKGTDRT